MPMLAFLPWLRLREPVRVGPFHLFPQGLGGPLPAGVTSTVAPDTLRKVLSQYRLSSNLPVRVLCVLQYADRPIGDEFDEAERTSIFRFAQHLAVSGMSGRRFIGGFPDEYTASGHYQAVIQAFSEPFNGSVNLTHRRKDGHASVMLGQSDVHFVLPAHLVSQGEPSLNLPLLSALQAVQTLTAEIHEHVDASVTQFLLANSDSPDVPLDAESIATYAALERVANSSQRVEDLQAKLPEILSLVEGSPWTAYLRDELGSCVEDGQPVLHAWLMQIYRLRGNVAHGKPSHWAPKAWSQQEHLVAGAFVYPLVLKCLLSQHGLYPLTQEDVAHALGLEGLLGDRPFYEAPPEAPLPDEPGDPVKQRESDTEVEDAAAPPRPSLTRWQRQFETINRALFGLALSGTIREVLDEGMPPPAEPPT